MLLLLKHAVLTCGIAFSSLAGMLTSASAVNNAPEGLTGILAPEIPEGLTEEDFAVLDGSWAEWSQAAAADVAKLYSEEPLSLADQRAALDAIASRVRVMEKALDDPAYAMIHRPLAALHGRLKSRLDLAEAALATLQLDPAATQKAQLEQSRNEVVAAHEALTKYLASLQGGAAWQTYLGTEELSQKLAGKSTDETLQVLEPIVAKIEGRDKLESEAQQKFLGGAPFLALADSIESYRSASLQPVNVGNNDQLRAALTDLIAAIEAYELSNQSAHAKAARSAFEQVCGLAADGGDLISAVMRAYYFNYNLHIVASEAFLDRLVAEERFENGPVDDYILGAKVDGTQRTRVLTGVNVLPSDAGLRFNIVANGHIVSNTAGVTDQATVCTEGNHCFTATKEVLFDWNQFNTQPARIGVNANNNTYGASTQFDGIPLLGAIGKSIAKSEARKKRPQSEAIARGRIADRVLPEFNAEGDQKFVDANTELNENFYPRLKKANIYPSATNLSSSETALFIDTRGMEAGELAGSRPNLLSASSQGATIEVHETAVNNLFDRVGLAGKTLTEAQVKQLFAEFFETAFGRKIEAIEDTKKDYEGDSTSLVFANEDPLRVRFEGDEVILTIRAGLKRTGEDDIPIQEISVRLTFSVEGDLIIAEAGDVGVSPIEKPESIQLQIARAGVIRQKISQALPRREINGVVDFKDDDTDRVVIVKVTELGFLNGWLRVVLE